MATNPYDQGDPSFPGSRLAEIFGAQIQPPATGAWQPPAGLGGMLYQNQAAQANQMQNLQQVMAKMQMGQTIREAQEWEAGRPVAAANRQAAMAKAQWEASNAGQIGQANLERTRAQTGLETAQAGETTARARLMTTENQAQQGKLRQQQLEEAIDQIDSLRDTNDLGELKAAMKDQFKEGSAHYARLNSAQSADDFKIMLDNMRGRLMTNLTTQRATNAKILETQAQGAAQEKVAAVHGDWELRAAQIRAGEVIAHYNLMKDKPFSPGTEYARRTNEIAMIDPDKDPSTYTPEEHASMRAYAAFHNDLRTSELKAFKTASANALTMESSNDPNNPSIGDRARARLAKEEADIYAGTPEVYQKWDAWRKAQAKPQSGGTPPPGGLRGGQAVLPPPPAPAARVIGGRRGAVVPATGTTATPTLMPSLGSTMYKGKQVNIVHRDQNNLPDKIQDPNTGETFSVGTLAGKR